MRYATSFRFDSVEVIESLPKGHLRTGRDLFEAVLAPHSAMDQGFVSGLHTVTDRNGLLAALNEIAEFAVRFGRSPIVHLEAHGGPEGLELANGSTIDWAEIAPILTTINKATRLNLLVVAAMCHGWHMSSILRPIDNAPAFAVLGTQTPIRAGDLFNAMKALYTALLEPGHDLSIALSAANGELPSRAQRFRMEGAELMLCKVFRHYNNELLTEESLEARVARIVVERARAGQLDVRQTMILRKEVTEALADTEKWFMMYRSRFLMLDEFPENAERFSLRYADCA